ncbi:MAG: hypothetical protein J3K34DRAFT_431482 [Monoraphidium minutum]|nr:MAG: hypothetical protein J3K34DRAFT_431482 [Monoraphidium minutum]
MLSALHAQVQRQSGRLAAARRQSGVAVQQRAVRHSHARDASAAASSSQPAAPLPSWEVRMLYDGACPLCMKEVKFLMGRDAGKGKIDFVDIAEPTYTAEANYGITYQQAMEKIHAVERDGRVITGIEVFRRLYEAVGLGYVYSVTKNPTVEKAANAIYDVWAKYRTQLTGREALGVILQRRAAEAAGRGEAGSLCADDATECDVPVGGEQRR